MAKSRTKDIGISKKEYEVGVVLERLFALAKANKCATCLLWHPTHVNLTRAELLCAACSARTKNKAKIGADLISKEDLERLERVYNGGKNTLKSKKYGHQESDNWASSFKHKKSHRHHHHSSRSRKRSVSSRYSSPSVSESSISSASRYSSSPSRNSYSSYEYGRKSTYSARDVSIPKSRRFDDADYLDPYYRNHQHQHQHHYPQEANLRNGKSSSRHQYDSKLRHSYSAHATVPSSKGRSSRHHSRHHHHHHDEHERERDNHGHHQRQHHSDRPDRDRYHDRDHHGHRHRHSHHSTRDSSAPPIPAKRTDARDIPGMVGIMASRQKAQTEREAMHSYPPPVPRQVSAANHVNGDFWPMVPPRKGQHGSARMAPKINGKTPSSYAALPSYMPSVPQQHTQAPGYHPTNPFSGSALGAPKAIADAKYKTPAFDLGHMRNALLNNGIAPLIRPQMARLQQDELARFAHLNTR